MSPVEDSAVMMMQRWSTSFLFGGNAPYVEEQYEAYLANRKSVSDGWRSYFDALQGVPAVDGSDAEDIAHAPIVSRFIEFARHSHVARRTGTDEAGFAQ